jgi:hypothetical protein
VSLGGGGGDGIGVSCPDQRVVVGGFLIASFLDAQALAPAGVVAATAVVAAVVKTTLTMEQSRFRVRRASTR